MDGQEFLKKLRDTPSDLKDLKRAVALLEAPTLTAKLTNLIGTPVEWAVKKLPDGAQESIQDAVRAALMKAVQAALWTMEDKPHEEASPWLHKAIAATTGAVSGFFGLPAMLVELPVTTTILMRTVADTARSEGFQLSDPQVQVACLEVFAFGGGISESGGGKNEAAETAYYSARAGASQVAAHTAKELSKIVQSRAAEAATAAGARGATAAFTTPEAAGILARIIDAIATRFGVVITEKMAAQAAPIIGAVSGVAINTMFADFFQDMARGHFIVRRLEERYGLEQVKAEYNSLALLQRV